MTSHTKQVISARRLSRQVGGTRGRWSVPASNASRGRWSVSELGASKTSLLVPDRLSLPDDLHVTNPPLPYKIHGLREPLSMRYPTGYNKRHKGTADGVHGRCRYSSAQFECATSKEIRPRLRLWPMPEDHDGRLSARNPLDLVPIQMFRGVPSRRRRRDSDVRVEEDHVRGTESCQCSAEVRLARDRHRRQGLRKERRAREQRVRTSVDTQIRPLVDS